MNFSFSDIQVPIGNVLMSRIGKLAMPLVLPKFLSKDEEICYWRDKAVEWEQKSRGTQDRLSELESEFDEFRESSSTLEKELEKDLEQSEQSIKEMRIRCNRLTFDLDEVREKLVHLNKENTDLHKEISNQRASEEKLLSYVRELEQKNDDVERRHRAMMETVNDIQVQLNSQIEKNALLETELDEKDALQTMVQRLKDEQRDLQQELQRQLRQRFPDNDRIRTSIDSNKLHSDEPQTLPGSPVKMSVSMGQLSPPATRTNALNLVGDLLRKVGSLESKLAASRTPRENMDNYHRETFRCRSQRASRPTSTGPPASSIHNAMKL